MNRLQKKCIYAAMGFHLLLLVVLLFGPGFLSSSDSAVPTTVLEIIPLTATDGSTHGGSPIPAPPPPTTVTPPAPAPRQQALPTPPEPRPVVQPPTPPTPEVETPERTEPNDLEVSKPKHVVNISTTLVTRSAIKNVAKSSDTSESDARARRAAQQRAIQAALNDLNKGLSSSTQIYVPGGSGGPLMANYRELVGSAYFNAWIIPDDVNADVAVAQAIVTIARDGTVLSAHITKSSGNAAVDRSVQAALDRVKFIAPFPDGSTDDQRTFPINFNLKAKQSLG